jgi:hypothetical protein
MWNGSQKKKKKSYRVPKENEHEKNTAMALVATQRPDIHPNPVVLS